METKSVGSMPEAAHLLTSVVMFSLLRLIALMFLWMLLLKAVCYNNALVLSETGFFPLLPITIRLIFLSLSLSLCGKLRLG